MKYINNIPGYATGLCFAAGIASMPCQGQNTPVIPNVHVEAQVLTTPQIQVETTIVPQIADEEQDSQAENDSHNKAKDLASKAKTRALKDYYSGQVFQNFSTALSYTPEMAKKTREIALLRRMLILKLSARDIEKALPLLKELRDQDKAAPAKPEQSLDEEYNELLRARPGDPMPPSSSEALRDAASGYRTRKQAVWEKMAQAIGREKAAGIRGMLRSESFGIWSSDLFQKGFVPPSVALPLSGRLRPVQPDVPPEPSVRVPRIEAPTDIDPAKPESDDDAPAAAAPEPRQEPAPRRANRGQRATPAAPSISINTAPGESSRIYRFDANNGRWAATYNVFGQTSLDDLIELFERKLAAMRH